MARPRSFDEDRVLHELRDRFWDAGYSATSLQDLMRISGLGKGSLYAAYGDKHSLFLRTLRTYVTEGNDALRAALESEPRAVDALRTMVVAPAGAGAERGCFLANSTCELATQHPDVRTEARQAYETMTELITACVARAQREGDLPADEDAEAFARSLLAAQQGVLYMGRTGMDVAALRQVAESLAERLLAR